MVAAACAHSFFLCEDGTAYGIGDPNTYNQRYTDYQSQKKFHKLEVPEECTDIRKIAASSNSRIILTKSG
jgi:hypothetical protein